MKRRQWQSETKDMIVLEGLKGRSVVGWCGTGAEGTAVQPPGASKDVARMDGLRPATQSRTRLALCQPVGHF